MDYFAFLRQTCYDQDMKFWETKKEDEGARIKLEIPPPVEVEQKIHESIIGQGKAVKELANLFVKIRSGIKPAVGVVDSAFLAGPSGVGKTESIITLAKMLAETNPEANLIISEAEIKKFGHFRGRSEKELLEMTIKDRTSRGLPLITEKEILSKIIKIDGGNFQHGHEIASILGSPHGYIGFKETVGLLHQRVLPKSEIVFKDFNGQERRVIFVLLDEAEKAHEDLHHAFLTILDKGRLTLGDNSVSDFNNAVIFFTSNVGNVEAEKSREHGIGFKKDQETPQVSFARSFKNMFRPEYRGRINKTIVFEHLNDQELAQITGLQLRKLEERFLQSGIRLELQILPPALDFLVGAGRNLSEGARAMKKVIEQKIGDQLILATQYYDLDGKTLVINVEGEISKEETVFYNGNAGNFTAKQAKA